MFYKLTAVSIQWSIVCILDRRERQIFLNMKHIWKYVEFFILHSLGKSYLIQMYFIYIIKQTDTQNLISIICRCHYYILFLNFPPLLWNGQNLRVIPRSISSFVLGWTKIIQIISVFTISIFYIKDFYLVLFEITVKKTVLLRAQYLC